ncbi:hypothetical protein F5148DRAFT_544894 [Russula earlei]|uniref:Uncharacterized protein n=1 Tax=Russula earlei TaxID=71964 RepID=A0ACC0TWE8_9AGAM|nr:hypothetical protein F5148DRAFT_544894 [Russula earlei]
MALTIPRDHLDLAAIAVHRILTDKGLNHVFLGGYELVVMGSSRGTKDVDVAVKKPLFNGFEKVKQAFINDSEFMVIEGNRTDAIRAIHQPGMVGIDILLQKPPKGSVILPGDPNNLPFLTAMHLFMSKIKCLAERNKPSDEDDLVYIFEHTTLDWDKITSTVKASQRNEALARHGNHPRVVEILTALNLK